MIYIIWKDANGQVLHGWDECTPPETNQVTYQDTPLVHGPTPVGSETNPQTVRLSISKFPGASSSPTQSITNCNFKLTSYYSDGVSYTIPTGYSEYTFCGDEGASSLEYSGYSGSVGPTEDLTTIGETWPSKTGDDKSGLMISMDGNCSFEIMEKDVDVLLSAKAGGSASGTDGEIDPDRYAEVAFKAKIPSDYSGGALQVLTTLEYIFTE